MPPPRRAAPRRHHIVEHPWLCPFTSINDGSVSVQKRCSTWNKKQLRQHTAGATSRARRLLFWSEGRDQKKTSSYTPLLRLLVSGSKWYFKNKHIADKLVPARTEFTLDVETLGSVPAESDKITWLRESAATAARSD